ncbi:MAG: zinc-ribbon domain-containing protein, partial [Promethearchaeota archaeon]
MYCRWCGSEILEDTKFCPHCGELLRDEEEVTPERDRAELEEEIE